MIKDDMDLSRSQQDQHFSKLLANKLIMILNHLLSQAFYPKNHMVFNCYNNIHLKEHVLL